MEKYEPERRGWRAAVAGASVVIVAAGWFAWRLDAGPLSVTGQGLACEGAQRVLEGEVPYRDFWTLYAPGSFYLLAGLFGVFGSSMMVARIAGAVLMATAVFVVYGLARRLVPAWMACVTAIVSAIVLRGMAAEYGTYPTVLPCILAAWWCATQSFEKGSNRWLFAAGACASAAMLFKHDVGAYAALSIGLTLLLRRLAGGASGFWKPLGVLLAGCCTLTLPVYLPLLMVAGRDMVNDLIVFPLTDFRVARPEHYPEPWPNWAMMTSPGRAVQQISMRLAFSIPTVTVLLSAAWLWRQRRRWGEPCMATLLMLTLALPFFWQAAHVQINTHIFTMTVLCGLLASGHVAWWWRGGRRALAGVVASLCLIAWVPRPLYEASRGLEDPAAFTLPRAAGVRGEAHEVRSIEEAVRFVQERTRPDEPVYVGLARHDAVLTSAPLVSFLLERPAATRYHELHPLINDTCAVQREMIADMERRGVRWMILWHVFDAAEQERRSARRREHMPRASCMELDTYLYGHFASVARFGRFDVRERD